MGRKFQIKRGNEADIPVLAPGEMGFTLDSKKLFVGTGSQNVPINSNALQEDASGNMNLKGNLTLKGSGNYGSKINFGDGDYVHISEPADDTLEIKGTRVNLVGTVSATTAAAGTNTTQVATTAFVQNAFATGNLPAGFGSFDRTLFERSSADFPLANVESGTLNPKKDFVLAKFIIPEDGVYKISFDYKLYNQTNTSYNSGELTFENTTTSISGTGLYRVINSEWYFGTSIGDGFNSSGPQVSIFLKDSFSSEWKNIVRYFYLEKGTLSTISGERRNGWNHSTLIYMFRNVKVSY